MHMHNSKAKRERAKNSGGGGKVVLSERGRRKRAKNQVGEKG